MTVRILKPDEWVRFFNAFSRRYRGRPVTVRLLGRDGDDEQSQTVANRMRLVGIAAERINDEVTAIEIIVGDSPEGHMTHVVREPSRVRVAQVTDGTDEVLLIDAKDGPTRGVDFSTAGLNQSLASLMLSGPADNPCTR
jgi:hypothetical protein